MLVAGCAPEQDAQSVVLPEPPANTEHLIVLSSAGVLGRLDPQDGQGGFGRRATYLTLTRQSGIDPMVLDAGDLLFAEPGSEQPELSPEATQARAELLLELLNETGLDAFVPGEADFAAGWDFLQRLRGRARFPMLAANLKAPDGSALLDAFVVVNRGLLKIGVFGLLSPALLAETPDVAQGRLRVDDPLAAARKAVHDLKNQGVDLIVALAHLDEQDLLKLANEAPGIDFVVAGHLDSDRSAEQRLLNGVPVFSPGREQRQLARLDVYLIRPPQGATTHGIVVDGTAAQQLRADFAQADQELQQIARAAGNKAIAEYVTQTPELRERYTNLQQQRRQAALDLGRLISVSHYIFNPAPLDASLGSSREIERLIQPWREKYAPQSKPAADDQEIAK